MTREELVRLMYEADPHVLCGKTYSYAEVAKYEPSIVRRLHRYADAILAASPPAVPPGHKLVPREPTTEMLVQGRKARLNPNGAWDAIYYAMWDAAPSQAGEPPSKPGEDTP